MAKVVIVGGGWSGCAAAIAAAKQGAEVTVLEKTDMLLGTGLVGGIMRNNGRYTAAEEAIAMGGGELFQVCDAAATHTMLDFPDHNHSTLYNVNKIEPMVKDLMDAHGIKYVFESRIISVKKDGDRIVSVTGHELGEFEADVFIDCTGSAGPQANCTKYGAGCMMCVLRCPSFGGRVSLTAVAGVKEFMAVNAEGKVGAYSGSCKLAKETLAPWVVEELERTGKCVIPLPEELVDRKKLGGKACQQYAGGAYAENAVILDTGHAKLMTSHFVKAKLHKVPGLEKAKYVDPYAGGNGNSVRFLAMAPHDTALKVTGLENLFCGGEKAGPLVGHTEAIVTGTLAGYNAARFAQGLEPVSLPTSTAIGESIAYVTTMYEVPLGLSKKYTYSGSVYFERMKELGLYTTDIPAIKERVRAAGVENIFAAKQSVNA